MWWEDAPTANAYWQDKNQLGLVLSDQTNSCIWQQWRGEWAAMTWVTNYFSKKWEPCAQQLPFCMTLALRDIQRAGLLPQSLCWREASWVHTSDKLMWESTAVCLSKHCFPVFLGLYHTTRFHRELVLPYPTMGETTYYFKRTALKDLRWGRSYVFLWAVIKRKRGSFNCAAEMAIEPREKQSEWTESY